MSTHPNSTTNKLSHKSHEITKGLSDIQTNFGFGRLVRTPKTTDDATLGVRQAKDPRHVLASETIGAVATGIEKTVDLFDYIGIGRELSLSAAEARTEGV